jgi:hypothetical protein
VNIHSRKIEVQGKEIALKIHNIRGEDAFGRFAYGRLRRFYHEGSIGGIIIFDKGIRTSFDRIERFSQEFREVRGPRKSITILGLITKKEEVSYEEGKTLADQLDSTYFECKPTDTKQIIEILQFLTTQILSVEKPPKRRFFAGKLADYYRELSQ